MEFDNKIQTTVTQLRAKGENWTAIARELAKQGFKRSTGKAYTGQEIQRKLESVTGKKSVAKHKQRGIKTNTSSDSEMLNLIQLTIASKVKNKSELVGAIVRSFS